MNDSTVTRYQDGGDIYAQVKATYGTQSANTLAQIVRDTRDTVNVSNYLGELRNGPFQSSNVAEIFYEQVTTDPFSAPAESLNNALGASVGSAIKGIFSNGWVLLVAILFAVGIVLYVKNNLFPR